MLLSAFEKGEATTIDAKRIGPPLLFERLWRDCCCRSVIENRLTDRKFGFPVERAVFLTVLHRIIDPGCYNEAEARNDAAAREATVAGLDKALRQGDKAL